MQNTVITYTDPSCLKETWVFAPYVNSLHICATESLRKGIYEYYQEKKPELILAPIISAGRLFSEMLGSWSTATLKMGQFAKLTKIMRSQEDVWDREICQAFRHNQMDVLETIRKLTEVGVTSGEFKPNSREEQLFQNVWGLIEAKDASFKSIRSKLSTSDNMEKRLRDALERCKIDMTRVPEQIKEIVLHGFYFITPLQYRLMSLFQKAGIRLVFLNLYDQRYPNTFRSVERFLSQWVPVEQWQTSRASGLLTTGWGDVFASSYEDGNRVSTDSQSGPQVIQFEDFQTFLSHYEISSDVEKYYSPSQENLNMRLKDYYPDLYSDRHFLAYPIGQYLLHLHQMWDEQKGELTLSEKGLFECFSSGWLQIEEHNACNFIDVLEEVLPYFATCKTIKEWRDQAALLKEVKMNAVAAFDHSINRFHRMMENPLLRFSFLQAKQTNVELLIQFMEKLFAQAELLFGQTEVRLHEHFERIEQLLEEGPNPESLIEKEQELLNQLRGRLKLKFTDDESYYMEDVAQAVSLYLGGQFNDDFKESILPINKFEDVDAAAFADKEVHLCTLDEESLPYVSKTIPWPLTRQTVQALQSPELETLFLREAVSSATARYLFYNALAFAKKVSLSWIRNTGNKKLEESVYIMILDLPAEKRGVLFETPDLESSECTEENMSAVFDQLQSFPADAAAEYALCPRRFYYSFVMKPFASYRSEFHQQSLYRNVLKASYKLSGASTSEINGQVSAIFPHWSEVRKRWLAEEAQMYINTFSQKYDPYDGRDYVRGRQLFQLLLSKYTVNDENLMEPADKLFETNNTNENFIKLIQDEEKLQLKATPTELCRFCPHLPICSEGHYPVDDKMRSYS